MKIKFAAIAAIAALTLSPVGAFAQHVDVGPGGVAVHGDHHEDRHETVVHEHHHDDHPVVHDHHDDHHETESRTTVIERH